MPRSCFAALVVAAGALVLAVGAGAQPAPGFTELDSVSSAGVQGNQDSEVPAISADGSRVAFDSFADTLVQLDANFSQDVFVHDRATGSTVRASDASGGVQGNNSSFGADVNGNDHLVVFSTFASNLGGNSVAT